MAHFAEIDSDGIVLRVCVVDDIHVDSEQHQSGVDWCVNLWGGTWVQTSYSGAFRKRFAGIGDTYHQGRNNFITAQPFGSWALDENDDWQAPIAKPNDGKEYVWDENASDWVETPMIA